MGLRKPSLAPSQNIGLTAATPVSDRDMVSWVQARAENIPGLNLGRFKAVTLAQYSHRTPDPNRQPYGDLLARTRFGPVPLLRVSQLASRSCCGQVAACHAPPSCPSPCSTPRSASCWTPC